MPYLQELLEVKYRVSDEATWRTLEDFAGAEWWFDYDLNRVEPKAQPLVGSQRLGGTLFVRLPETVDLFHGMNDVAAQPTKNEIRFVYETGNPDQPIKQRTYSEVLYFVGRAAVEMPSDIETETSLFRIPFECAIPLLNVVPITNWLKIIEVQEAGDTYRPL